MTKKAGKLVPKGRPRNFSGEIFEEYDPYCFNLMLEKDLWNTSKHVFVQSEFKVEVYLE